MAKQTADDSAFKEWLQRAVKASGSKIADSHYFLSLFTPNYEKDPLCALQLGIAIMLDKPIYLLVPSGTPVPENLRRLARGLEFFEWDNEEDLHRATKRLLAAEIGEYAHNLERN